MSKYRDDLGAAHRRIETLTAKVAEREAAIVARDLEIQELRAYLELIEERSSEATTEGRRRSVSLGGLSGFRGPLLFGITVIGVSGVLALGVTPRRGQVHLASPSDYALATEPIPAEPPPVFWEEIEIELDEISDQPAGHFSHAEAADALAKVAEDAIACRKSADEPTGVATVLVTFGASGRVSNVELDSAAFEETQVGECIVATFHQARVPAFEGSPVTVVSPVAIP
jgi:hypothetical protein